MSTRQIVDALENANEDLARLLMPTSGKTAIESALYRLWDQRPDGMGAQNFDGDKIASASSSGNPPPGFGQDDKAAADRNEAHRRALRIRQDADWLYRLAERANPRAPSPKDKIATEAENDPTCAHCTKWVRNPELVHRTSDANGNLPQPLPLGRWCYEFARTNGRLPSKNECERHDNGQVVRVPA